MTQTYSNFQFTTATTPAGKLSTIYHATVDITTKKMFRRPRTKTHPIYKKTYSLFWRFEETGELCPYEVCNLADAYAVKHNTTFGMIK